LEYELHFLPCRNICHAQFTLLHLSLFIIRIARFMLCP
jgi:hypothetical protein